MRRYVLSVKSLIDKSLVKHGFCKHASDATTRLNRRQAYILWVQVGRKLDQHVREGQVKFENYMQGFQRNQHMCNVSYAKL